MAQLIVNEHLRRGIDMSGTRPLGTLSQDSAFSLTRNFLGFFSGTVSGDPVVKEISSFIDTEEFYFSFSDAIGQEAIVFFGDSSALQGLNFFRPQSLTPSVFSPRTIFRGDDSITGNSFVDFVKSGAGNDSIQGLGGADTLYGESGQDTIKGGDGSDLIIGGAGKDMLIGGGDKGKDIFRLEAPSESGLGESARDVIVDFQNRVDDIDVRAIDADLNRAGDQKFKFAGEVAKANSIWFIKNPGGGLLVYADVNGDALADLEIEVLGISKISSGDFLL